MKTIVAGLTVALLSLLGNLLISPGFARRLPRAMRKTKPRRRPTRKPRKRHWPPPSRGSSWSTKGNMPKVGMRPPSISAEPSAKRPSSKRLDGARKPLGCRNPQRQIERISHQPAGCAGRPVCDHPVREFVRQQEIGHRDRDADARQRRQVARVGLLHQVSRACRRACRGCHSPSEPWGLSPRWLDIVRRGAYARCSRDATE